MCRLAGVSRAGFYRRWEERAPDESAMALRDAVQRVALQHRSYGCRRIAAAGMGREPLAGARHHP